MAAESKDEKKKAKEKLKLQSRERTAAELDAQLEKEKKAKEHKAEEEEGEEPAPAAQPCMCLLRRASLGLRCIAAKRRPLCPVSRSMRQPCSHSRPTPHPLACRSASPPHRVRGLWRGCAGAGGGLVLQEVLHEELVLHARRQGAPRAVQEVPRGPARHRMGVAPQAPAGVGARGCAKPSASSGRRRWRGWRQCETPARRL